MRVSKLLGLTVIAAFTALFFLSIPASAGEHPWIENPAKPPDSLHNTTTGGSQIEGPMTPDPNQPSVIHKIIPQWLRVILIHIGGRFEPVLISQDLLPPARQNIVEDPRARFGLTPRRSN